MKTVFILIFALVLFYANTHAQSPSSSLTRVGGGGGGDGYERVPLGDVIWEGKTYQNATGYIAMTGDIVLTGSSNLRGTGGTGMIPWDKTPWDLKKKMEKAREVAIAEMKAKPRISAHPQMLVGMWGKPVIKDTAIPRVTLLTFDTPEYLIDAHCEQTQVVMMEIERKAGWTKESTEAVLLTMQDGTWQFDATTELWKLGSTQARMIGSKKLRVMSYRWAGLVNGSTTKRPASGL